LSEERGYNRSVHRLQRLREGLSSKMAKNSSLGRNEILFSGRKLQVQIPTTDLCVLNDHDEQRPVKAQACWGSLQISIPYNAIVDPRIDWSISRLLSKPAAIKRGPPTGRGVTHELHGATQELY